jgi:hypothetical protein
MGSMAFDQPRLEDPELPAVGILLGGEARHPLDALLAGFDTEVTEFRLRQVTWWPGRSITVRYAVATSAGDTGRQIVACSGSIPDGAAIVESDDVRIGLWILPHDPALPGLAPALDAGQLRAMLASIGRPTTKVASRLRAYRPGRRAVVQVETDTTRVFLKLGRPRSIAALHATHRLLADVLPVPTSLGYDPDLGLLAMPAGRGRTLRETLDAGGDVPSPGALDDLLRRIPPPATETRNRSPLTKLSSLAELLGRVVPDQRNRVEDIVGRVGSETSQDEQVPNHGDFHDGQILVDDGRITGLLDVDTHGMGHSADDPARMLGHLQSRSPHAPRADRLDDYVSRLAAHWLSRCDARELVRRTAAVMLGLATGPFRVQEAQWPALVRERIGRAERALESDENPLIAVSRRSHPRPAS